MTVMHLARSSRRSRSTILKMGLQHIRSQPTTNRRVKLFPKLTLKPKRHTDYVSSWINKWSVLHLIILSICIIVHCGPSLINTVGNNTNSLLKDKYLHWSYFDWCSSSSRFLNNTGSFVIQDQSVILLITICGVMSIAGFLLYFNLNEKVVESSTNGCSSHFWQRLLALGMFVAFSIGNQWISSLVCRPVEILYDPRFTSILGVQVFGFIICLHVAYGLGSILKPLFDQERNDLYNSDSHV